MKVLIDLGFMNELFSDAHKKKEPKYGCLFDMVPARLLAYIQFILTVYMKSYVLDDVSVQNSCGKISGKDTTQTDRMIHVPDKITMMAVTHIQQMNEENRFYLLPPQKTIFQR